MKKLTIVLMFVVMLIAACSNSSDNTDTNQNVNTDDQDVTENSEDENNESNQNTEVEEEETNQQEENVTEENDNKENGTEDQSDENNQSTEDELKELSFQLFSAQREENYEALEGALSEGSSLNKDKNTFHFENVDYPHEQEFIQDTEENIEYRYIHEVDEETIIIGFGIVDTETESSFAIDIEYIREDGEWKMNDMDMNA